MPTSEKQGLSSNSMAPRFCPKTGIWGEGACKYPHPALTLVGIWARPPFSPGTPLPPPRVAVPGERRRAGSVSWGAIFLFVPPLCPALQRVAQEVPSRLPAPQNSPGRSDPSLPRAEPAVPPQCASTSRAPHPGGGQVKAIYLSTCGAARHPVPHSGSLHFPGALSQNRSIPRLQVARAEAGRAGHLSRAPQVSARRMRS